MFKKSIFLKVLLVLLLICGVVTVVALIVGNSNDPLLDEKVETPTEPVTDVNNSFDGPMVDVGAGKVVVATNASENTGMYTQENTANGRIRYAFGVTGGLKPNTTYQLSWSISESINSLYYGIQLMYQTPGMEYPDYLSGDNLYNNYYVFTTNDATEQYLYFYVAEGDYDEAMDTTGLANMVKESVVFTLYELVESE